jgi:predicted nucleotidyltransferase
MVVIMNMIDFLKSNKNSRKIFGKRELRIIEKQLFGVSLTQSEKNRLSRDIRPKLEMIKELHRFNEDFKLKKSSEIKNIINEAKEIILEDKLNKNIKEIIVFGSFVDNTMTFRSDIDMAVKFNQIDLKEATKFRIRISGKVKQKVDIQVYNILPIKIKKEIDAKGKKIYENR